MYYPASGKKGEVGEKVAEELGKMGKQTSICQIKWMMLICCRRRVQTDVCAVNLKIHLHFYFPFIQKQSKWQP